VGLSDRELLRAVVDGEESAAEYALTLFADNAAARVAEVATPVHVEAPVEVPAPVAESAPAPVSAINTGDRVEVWFAFAEGVTFGQAKALGAALRGHVYKAAAPAGGTSHIGVIKKARALKVWAEVAPGTSSDAVLAAIMGAVARHTDVTDGTEVFGAMIAAPELADANA
jgi:hypothetical protein